MHQQTQELLAAAAQLSEAMTAARAAFHAVCKQVDPALIAINREAEEALVEETDDILRAHLDGRVCQRARSAVTHLTAARRELAGVIAASVELGKDLAALAAAAEESGA